MLSSILIASLAASGGPPALPVGRLGRHGTMGPPVIELWTNRDDVMHRGDKVKLYFRTDVDAYVTLFRVDTDGRMRVLFPLEPRADNYARGGERYQVDPRDDGYTFRVDDYPGQGYLFAVATVDPFVYDAYLRNGHWDYREIGTNGRVTGDPYVAIGDLVNGIVPEHYVDYDYDVLPYYVEERYEYPRFLCYECHAYASFPYWDPYDHSCFKFRIVVYDDPYYYPARARYGTTVVYRRPTVFAPRYVFKERGASDAFVETVRERPVDQSGRRRVDPGATRRTLPGGALLPTPRSGGTAADAGVRRAVSPQGRDAGQRVGGGPATPILERRDPARAPDRVSQATPRRSEPTAPPKRVEPAKREPPKAPPKAEPKRRDGPKPSTEPPKRKSDPPKRDPPKRGN